jgi:hypothetical protein
MNVQPILDYAFYTNFANKFILKFAIFYHILYFCEKFLFPFLLMQPEHVAVTMGTTCAAGWLLVLTVNITGMNRHKTRFGDNCPHFLHHILFK